MKRYAHIACVAVFGLAIQPLCAVSTFAQQFIDALNDVPQMAGMSITTDNLLIFETASGRIVELKAQIPSWQQAKTFYQATLPSLGWSEINEMHFVRDSENLKISAINAEWLQINLSPRP